MRKIAKPALLLTYLAAAPFLWIGGASLVFLAGSQLWGDVFMVTAAVVAGAPILRSAVHGLIARVIGIDLLVSIAAIGALFIGELWEAAAVTFLFAIGHALENATLNKTRSALA